MSCAFSAGARELNGPSETSGVESVEVAGLLKLAEEFPALKDLHGRQFRARLFTLAPGAVIAEHTHDMRPAYAYIIEGSVTEHRSTADAPVVYRAGDVAIEHGNLTHWLENTSGTTVRALVVDIFTPEQAD